MRAVQSLHVAGRGNVRIDALVGSATAAGVRKSFINLLQQPFASLMNALVPRAPVVPALEAEKLSKNPAVVRAYRHQSPPCACCAHGTRTASPCLHVYCGRCYRAGVRRGTPYGAGGVCTRIWKFTHLRTLCRARADPAIHRGPQAVQGLRARLHRVLLPRRYGAPG